MTKSGKKSDPVLSLATDLLLRGEKEGAQLYSQLHTALDTCDLNGAEKAKVTALVTGVCEHLLSLDYILNLFSKTKTAKMKPQIRTILRLGVCQLVFMERTSDAPAVSSCVELARERGFASLTGYVNGVLRTVAREKNGIRYPDLSTRYSVPAWICRRLENSFGTSNQKDYKIESKSERRDAAHDVIKKKPENNNKKSIYGAEQILQYYEQEQSVTIRLDERLSETEKDAWLQRMKNFSAKMTIRRHPLLRYAYILEQPGDLRTLPGFAEGSFYVQDAGAQLVVELAGIKEGDTVIDVCAAPGGKSVHAYAKCSRKAVADKVVGGRAEGDIAYGHVIAMDLTERKCDLIRANAKRLHADKMEVYAHDARKPDERFLGLADVVICDLPCSGLGIMGRKADIRYRLREEDIAELAALQKEILRASISYLKKGGTLLYATCTLTSEENEENARFIFDELGLKPVDLRLPLQQAVLKSAELQSHPTAESAESAKRVLSGTYDYSDAKNELLATETLSDGYLTLPPGRFLTDGFFISLSKS